MSLYLILWEYRTGPLTHSLLSPLVTGVCHWEPALRELSPNVHCCPQTTSVSVFPRHLLLWVFATVAHFQLLQIVFSLSPRDNTALIPLCHFLTALLSHSLALSLLPPFLDCPVFVFTWALLPSWSLIHWWSYITCNFLWASFVPEKEKEMDLTVQNVPSGYAVLA